MLRDTCVPPDGHETETAAPASPRRGGKQNREALGSAVSEYHNSGALNNPNLMAALALAKAGFAIFPTRPDKKPLVRWKTEATTDLGQIKTWWTRWPNAMPALPTGGRNGISVLDLDRKDGRDGFVELRKMGLNPGDLSHIIVATPSGGRHIYFKHRPGLGNSADRIAPGIDVRAEGGYVIAPGAVNRAGVYEDLGYELIDDILGLPPWPAALKPNRRKARAPPPKRDYTASKHDLAWAREQLRTESEAVAEFEPGGRNHELNRAAYILGQNAAVGLLGAEEIKHSLLAACARNGLLADDRHSACTKSIKSGFTTGMGNPKYPPIDPQVVFEDLRDPDEISSDPKRGTKAGNRGAELTFLTPAECAELPPQDYVIKGLIGPGQIGCIFGDPGAGKSLIALDMAYAVAQGRATFGMKTKQGEVFYIAAEDATGLQGRVTALHLEHGDADSFKLVKGVSDLFAQDAPDLKALKLAVRQHKPSLIFIDTLAMAFPGMDENTAESMGHVVEVSRTLAAYGAAVILIHHGTKAEGNTPRGHSLLNGALDMALRLRVKDNNGIARGGLTKNRNGTIDLDIAFKIETHDVGVDADGETITAAYAVELPPGIGSPVPKMKKSTREAQAILSELLAGKREIAESEWRDACVSGRKVSPAEKSESRRRTFRRAVGELAREDVIEVEDNRVRWANSAAEQFEDISSDNENA